MDHRWHYIVALLPCQKQHLSSVYVWAISSEETFGVYSAMSRAHADEIIIVQPLNTEESERLEQKVEKSGIQLHDAKKHGYVTPEEIVKPNVRFQKV
ncbi:hypothetical protein HYX05_03490 [Candidatus Woesearchaeota archaeon]|nr:hypothetical protein [Candidatus Woesearchaeota archaeon]